MAREIYAYWKVDRESADETARSVSQAQALLCERIKGLQSRLLRRPDRGEPQLTYMEVYRLEASWSVAADARRVGGTGAAVDSRKVSDLAGSDRSAMERRPGSGSHGCKAITHAVADRPASRPASVGTQLHALDDDAIQGVTDEQRASIDRSIETALRTGGSPQRHVEWFESLQGLDGP